MSFTFEEVKLLLHLTRPLHVAERWEQAVHDVLALRVAAAVVPEPSPRRVEQLEAQVDAMRARALKAEARVAQLEKQAKK